MNFAAVDPDDARAPLPDIIWEAQLQLARAENRYRMVQEALDLLVRTHLRRTRGLVLPPRADACSISTSPDVSELTVVARPERQPPEYYCIAVEALASEPIDSVEEGVEGFRTTPKIVQRMLRLGTRARQSFDTEAIAADWLFKPLPGWGGMAPVDLLSSGEAVLHLERTLDALNAK